MNIVQVLPYFSPKFGGPFTSVCTISEELSKLGHNVTILTTDYYFDTKSAEDMKNKGIDVINFKCVFNIGLFLYSPSMKNWLKQNIRKYDIIHMNEFRSYQNNVTCEFAIKFNVPYILQARGSLLPYNIKIPIYLRTFKKLYDFFWGFKILTNVNKVIALTDIERDQYISMGVPNDKVDLIPNAFNFQSSFVEKGSFRSKYGIKDDEKIILFLGRINKIKGLDLLVDSFTNLSEGLNNIKLVIVGPDDGFLDELKNLIKDSEYENNIIITGPLYGKSKFEAFSDSDLYVLPSKYEAFGNTIIESLANETPVVVSEKCGIANFIHKNGGLKFEYNEEDLTKKMYFLLTDEPLLKYYGFMGKKYVLENYSISKVVKKLLESYGNMISKGR